jgi:hypothetical protein
MAKWASRVRRIELDGIIIISQSTRVFVLGSKKKIERVNLHHVDNVMLSDIFI